MNDVRPWVDAFAEEMFQKLHANYHKGGREGWQRENVAAFLLPRMLHEVGELVAALGQIEEAGGGQEERVARSMIRRECADIANFAMMIADVAGDLRPRRPR